MDKCSLDSQYITGLSKSLEKVIKVEAGCVKPFLRGKQIRKYEPPRTNAYLICPYNISARECILLSKIEMPDKFPLAMNYLEANQEKLALREKGKFQGQNWYAFGYPKSMILFHKPKIIVPD